MKKRLGILVVLLCLLLSVTALACSGNGGGEGNTTDPEHVHAYSEVAATNSTCLVHGVGAHYTCEGCEKIFVKNGEDYVETTLAALELPLGDHSYGAVAETPSTCITHGHKAHYACGVCHKLFTKSGETYTETTLAALEKEFVAHSFNGIVITTQPNVTEYSLDGEFDPTGMVVTKTCSVAGCDGEIADGSEIDWVYENGQTAFKGGMTKITVKVGEFSADVAISVDSRVAIPVIHSKVYTGEKLIADTHDGDYYTVTTNEGGTNVGSYPVVFTLISGDYTWNSTEGVDGLTATVNFEITKAENAITEFTVGNTTCGVAPEVQHLTLTFGNDTIATTAHYKYYKDGVEVEGVKDLKAGEGTYTVAVTVDGTENWTEVTETRSFTVSHDYSDWDTEESDEVDYAMCLCGLVDKSVTFIKKLTEVQELIVTEVTHAFNEGADTKVIPNDGATDGLERENKERTVRQNEYTETYKEGSLSLKGIGDGTSTYTTNEIRLPLAEGSISLGTDISALKLNMLSDKRNHGEQTLIVEVLDGKGKTHLVTVPVLLITREIATTNDMKLLFVSSARDSEITVTVVNGAEGAPTSYMMEMELFKSGTKSENPKENTYEEHTFIKVYGYYRLAESIPESGLTYDAYNTGSLFYGVLDGNDKAINIGHSKDGLPQFGLARRLQNAVIKNLTINVTKYIGSNSYRALFTQDANDVEFNRVTVNHTSEDAGDDTGTVGYMFRGSARNVTFKDFTLNAEGKAMGSLFGELYDTTSYQTFTFDNFVLKCASIRELAHKGTTPYPIWNYDGISATINEAVPTGDNVIKLSDTDYAIQLGVMNTTKLKSVKYNGKTLSRVSVSGGKLTGKVSELGLVKADNGKTGSFEVEFNYGANFDVKATVGALLVAELQKVSLSKRQMIILQEENKAAATEATLDLGDYSNHTILAASLQQVGGDPVAIETEGKTIKLTDAIKNGKHGEQNIVLTTEVALEDSDLTADYEITVPVIIVTEKIMTRERLVELVSRNRPTEKYHEGKYFILGADITMTTYDLTGGMNEFEPNKGGFAGTLDGKDENGNKHKLKGAKAYGGGLFGSICEGTLKNVDFELELGGANRIVIAAAMYNPTIENVTITLTDSAQQDIIKNPGSYNGIISSNRVWGTVKITNVTINAGGHRLVSIFGAGSKNSTNATYEFSNFVINVLELQCLAVDKDNNARIEASSYSQEEVQVNSGEWGTIKPIE